MGTTNVIDAFVVSFGIDARGWKSGERDVRKSMRDVKDEAKDSFGTVEKRGSDAALAIRGLASEAAGFFLILAGANSLKALASDMLTGAASASRFGETIGMSAGRVTGWQVAIEKVGGSAEDANMALQRMMDIAYKYKYGQGAEPGLMALGIDVNDLNKADPEAMLMKLAEARTRFSPQDYARRLQMLGLPQSTIYLLEQGTEAVKKQVDAAEQHANITKRDEEAAKDLQGTLVDLSNDIKGQLRPALTELVERLDIFLKDLDALNLGAPVAIGMIAGLATAALGALGPWGRLAAVIGLVVGGLDSLIQKNPQVKSTLDNLEAPIRKWLAPIIGDWWFERPGDNGAGSAGAPGGAPPSGATGTPTIGKTAAERAAYIEKRLLSAGISPAVTKGIVAALYSENTTFDPTKQNSIGALGISQLLGSRKKALLKMTGGKMPTLAQEVTFLISELFGGDPGGASVLSAKTSDAALTAMVASFLRPQGKNWEHYGDYLGNLRRGRSYLAGGTGGTTNIGTIVVNTKATDAKGIARDIGSALRERAVVSQAAVGLTP